MNSAVAHAAGRPPLGAAPSPTFSPLYQQIKALILQSLLALEWKPGEAIPSEMDLAARYRVSQGTVRKAIDELAAENLVVRRQGKGTFVTTHVENHTQYRFLRLMPDSGDANSEGPAERHIIDCKRLRATTDIARALGLRSGDSVLQVRRVLAYSGVPTILEDIWLPGGPFKDGGHAAVGQHPPHLQHRVTRAQAQRAGDVRGGAQAFAVDDVPLGRAFAVGVAAVGHQPQKAVLGVVFNVGGDKGAFALPAHHQVLGGELVY
ncbi:MAG: GntR family transcriptional regulator, partial [Rhodoferax sp.]